MAWIEILSPSAATGRLKRIYDAAIQRAGRIYNVIAFDAFIIVLTLTCLLLAEIQYELELTQRRVVSNWVVGGFAMGVVVGRRRRRARPSFVVCSGRK